MTIHLIPFIAGWLVGMALSVLLIVFVLDPAMDRFFEWRDKRKANKVK